MLNTSSGHQVTKTQESSNHNPVHITNNIQSLPSNQRLAARQTFFLTSFVIWKYCQLCPGLNQRVFILQMDPDWILDNDLEENEEH